MNVNEKEKSFVYNFIKKYAYWFVVSLILLISSISLSIDPYLTFSELLYKTGVALFVLTLSYTIRRVILGYIEWQHPYDKIYALVILIVIALVFTFVSVPTVNFTVVNR